MKVQAVPIDRVRPYERNPRRNEQAVDKVAASIREFGFQQPIVVDKDHVVIAGHTRLKAAQKLGLTKVPILVAENLTPDQVRAYRIADNRTNEESGWENELLKLELGDLDAAGFDLALTGFDPDELAEILKAAGGDGDDDAEPTPPDNPISVLGDLWLLGPHRVLCGDATSADDVGRLLGDARPNLMVTDPPYGVNYDASWRDGVDLNLGKRLGEKGSGRALGKVSNDDRSDWREAWALFPGDVVYCWHASLHVAEVQLSLEAAGFEMRAHLIWNKQHFTFSQGAYHWKHEPCWYAVRKGKSAGWRGGRKQTTVWDIPNNNPLGGGKEQKVGHSTQKPMECMARPMRNNSKAGEPVYDPFLGSGSSVIAAEREGRVCLGLELDPAYVDVICRRYQDLTGTAATLEGDGRSFEELAKTRAKKTRSHAAA